MKVEITLPPEHRKPLDLQRFLEGTWRQLQDEFTEALRRNPREFTYTIEAKVI